MSRIRSNKSASFLRSFQWKSLRVKALNRDGCQCCLCGSHDGLNVHHILYRRLYPTLQLELGNLLTVCKRCHWGIHKGVLNLMLADWLRHNRPAQWDWVVQHIIDKQTK